MEASPDLAYLNPAGLNRPIPIERFLPPCPAGVIGQVLPSLDGDPPFVLDPFGSNPLLPIEIAQNGGRVLVACNNPVLAFCLKLLATPGTQEQFLAAIADLASLRRGEERMETHIKSLYQTRCAICHQEIQAIGFLWHRGDTTPYARLYRCPYCGDEGERAATDEDADHLLPVARSEKLHRARAISKVIKENEEDRVAVEEALKAYNPRALYVLFTLLNKIEGMEIDLATRERLQALMITLLDAGTSFWPWPPTPDTPHQLTVPMEYLEKNLWAELENAVNLWTQPAQSVQCTHWPHLPENAGIILFEGPIRSLKELPASTRIDQLICLPPRPNQAFWTLSSLWSAWLWGEESGSSFRNVLGRHRFDWHWHTVAIHQAIDKAVNLCPAHTPAYIQIGEPSAGMVLATLMAARTAELEFIHLAYRSSSEGIQIQYQTEKEPTRVKTANLQSICRNAIRNLLLELGEPCEYLRLYTAALVAAVQSGSLPEKIEEYSNEKSSEFQGLLARLFADRSFLRRLDVSSQDFESGKWWLLNPEKSQPPLADRVEMAIVHLLQKQPTLPAKEIGLRINRAFPGLLTPASELIEYCLGSYADWEEITQTWVLREKEQTAHRRTDIDKAIQRISELGKKLGYEVAANSDVTWSIKNQEQYHFFFSAAALLARSLPAENEQNTQLVFIFPGSRSALLKYKLMRDPYLHERTLTNWHFLKLRALSNLAARNDLTPALWAMLLDSDPINLEESQQLRMFG